jgi:hypothetical protein
MSKTNDTSKLVTLDNQLDDHGALADSELDGVNGGAAPAAAKLYEACCKGTHIPNVTIE